MSEEIRLLYEDVEKTLADLKTSIQSVEPSAAISIDGENKLDAVAKLNEINQTLETLVHSYKTLLLQNEEATQQSIDTLKGTEEKLASGMRVQK